VDLEQGVVARFQIQKETTAIGHHLFIAFFRAQTVVEVHLSETEVISDRKRWIGDELLVPVDALKILSAEKVLRNHTGMGQSCRRQKQILSVSDMAPILLTCVATDGVEGGYGEGKRPGESEFGVVLEATWSRRSAELAMFAVDRQAAILPRRWIPMRLNQKQIRQRPMQSHVTHNSCRASDFWGNSAGEQGE
jgi:hypothetical protein